MTNQPERRPATTPQTVFFAGIAILSQLGFWFYSMPWPQMQQTASLSGALVSCLVSVLTLLVVPLIISVTVLGKRPADLGLGLGDRSFGLKAVFWCAPAMMVGTWIGSSDPQIQSFYPIPGDSIGQSASDLLVWFSAYLTFYVSFEFFYRGYLMTGIDKRESGRIVWTYIAIQAVCCFLIHIGKPTAELIASFPASVLFGWIAWRSGSIWYGLLIHFAVGVVNDLGAIG